MTDALHQNVNFKSLNFPEAALRCGRRQCILLREDNTAVLTGPKEVPRCPRDLSGPQGDPIHLPVLSGTCKCASGARAGSLPTRLLRPAGGRPAVQWLGKRLTTGAQLTAKPDYPRLCCLLPSSAKSTLLMFSVWLLSGRKRRLGSTFKAGRTAP